MLKNVISKMNGSLELFSSPIIRGVGGQFSIFSYYVERMSYQKNNSYVSIIYNKLKIKVC
jgi:hypothetical protein